MAKDYQVLEMLIPEGGWVLTGEGYENIEFLECDPITKEQFEAGFAQFDAWNTQQKAAKATARQAVLARLNLTEEEAQLILGGSN